MGKNQWFVAFLIKIWFCVTIWILGSKNKKGGQLLPNKITFSNQVALYTNIYTRPYHNFKAYSLNNEQLPRTREASVVGNWRRASNFCNPVRLPPCSSESPPPRVVKNYKFCNIDKGSSFPPLKSIIESPLPSTWCCPPHPPRRPTARRRQVSSQSVPRSREHCSPCRSPEQPSK